MQACFKAMIDGLRVTPPWAEALDLDQPATFNPPPSLSRLIVFSSVASAPYPEALPPWEGVDYRYHRMDETAGAGARRLARRKW
jgi:hypothetical protein